MPELRVKTSTGKEGALSDKAIEERKRQVRGELFQRGDPIYNEARKIYNAMIDKHPALIARCVDVADVLAAVKFARENEILVSIRGGGHSAAGLGMRDDGLVIDLSRMKDIRVDPSARTVRVEGGCVWGEVDHELTPSGWRCPAASSRRPVWQG